MATTKRGVPNPGQFKAGAPRHPKAGRRAGTPNKVTASIKQAFKEAFDNLGGTAALMRWAKKNPTEFYRQVTKLIPLEITGADGGPITYATKERDALRDKVLASPDQEAAPSSPRVTH